MDGAVWQQLMAAMDHMQAEMAQGFAEVNARLDGVIARFDGVIAQSDGVIAQFDEMNTRLDEMQAVSVKGNEKRMTKRENGVYSDSSGDIAQVPFQNGMFPWGKEVDGPDNTRVTLPELRSVDAVKSLTAPELYGFFQGYYPGEALPPAARCREKILLAIGMGKALHLL